MTSEQDTPEAPKPTETVIPSNALSKPWDQMTSAEQSAVFLRREARWFANYMIKATVIILCLLMVSCVTLVAISSQR